MSATLASVLLVILVVSLTQPHQAAKPRHTHLLDSRAVKPRHTHLLDSRAAKPRHTHLLDSRATKPQLTLYSLDSRAAKPRLTLYSLDSRAATVQCPSTSLTTTDHYWTSTRPLLEVTTYLVTRILLSTSSSMATMTGLDKLELFNPHLETFERYV